MLWAGHAVCGVRHAACGVRHGACSVRRAAYGVWRAACGIRRATYGVWRVGHAVCGTCGVWHVVCGVWCVVCSVLEQQHASMLCQSTAVGHAGMTRGAEAHATHSTAGSPSSRPQRRGHFESAAHLPYVLCVGRMRRLWSARRASCLSVAAQGEWAVSSAAGGGAQAGDAHALPSRILASPAKVFSSPGSKPAFIHPSIHYYAGDFRLQPPFRAAPPLSCLSPSCAGPLMLPPLALSGRPSETAPFPLSSHAPFALPPLATLAPPLSSCAAPLVPPLLSAVQKGWCKGSSARGKGQEGNTREWQGRTSCPGARSEIPHACGSGNPGDYQTFAR